MEGNKKILAGIIILIIVGIAGCFVYTKFTEKEPDNTGEIDKPKEIVDEDDGIPSSIDKSKYENTTYKNGNNTLKIVSLNDANAVNDAKQYSFEETNPLEPSFYGYYNGTIYSLTYDGYKTPANSKYIVLGGIDLQNANNIRCTYSTNFIINTDNNSIFKMSSNESSLIVNRAGGKYYFTEIACSDEFNPIGVYNESLKKIGDYYFGKDSNGNIYVINNGYITKYAKDGNIVNQSKTSYNLLDINKNVLIYEDTIYLVVRIDDKYYFINPFGEEKYQLDNMDAHFSSFNSDTYPVKLVLNNNIIEIYVNDYIAGTGNEDTLMYTYNPTTKEISKKF